MPELKIRVETKNEAIRARNLLNTIPEPIRVTDARGMKHSLVGYYEASVRVKTANALETDLIIDQLRAGFPFAEIEQTSDRTLKKLEEIIADMDSYGDLFESIDGEYTYF